MKRNAVHIPMSPKMQMAQLSAKYNKAREYQLTGNAKEAKRLYEELLRVQPNHFDALQFLALVEIELGDLRTALNLLDRAIAVKHDFAPVYSNRALILNQIKQHDAALSSVDRAIKLNPKIEGPYCAKATILLDLLNFSEALENCNIALSIKPDFAEAWANKSNALKELGDLEQALEAVNNALSINENYADAYHNRACIYQGMGRLEESLADFNKSIDLNQYFYRSYYNRGFLLLEMGNYEEGWKEHEWRWRWEGASVVKRNFPQPTWLGEESLEGKKILLHSEQGHGDTFQFCRYIPMVKALGAYVIFELDPAMLKIMKSLDGIDEYITQGSILPEFDLHCPLMSLPLAFKTTLKTVPATIPYLKTDIEKVDYWKNRLGPKTITRVGLVWSGGLRKDQPSLWNVNQRRNMPLHKFGSLKNINAEFYSLQKGNPAEAELKMLKSAGWEDINIIDYASELKDFTDTAALIENLDLVISVDTSTLHLAGALGKPVWLLNRFDTCWRWMEHGTESPWYPTLKIYRQQFFGDWDSVMSVVTADLMQQCP